MPPEDEATEAIVGMIHSHHLSHLPPLGVSALLLTARFSQACDSMKCPSKCCASGVLLDIAHKKTILDHREAIWSVMDPDQEKDPARWFDGVELADPDFPSGRCTGTEANARGCVFLDKVGRCVLQKAKLEGKVQVELKPFYCTAFPILVDNAVVTLDVHTAEANTQCCAASSTGTQTAIEVFEFELVHTLGRSGFDELRAIARSFDSDPSAKTRLKLAP